MVPGTTSVEEAGTNTDTEESAIEVLTNTLAAASITS